MRKRSQIPTVWRIDVEPDEHRPSVGEKPWEGFAQTMDRVHKLSARLEDRSGRSVRPAWFLRMDPDIKRCFGRADYVVHRHGALIDELINRKAPIGIHVHQYRWNAEKSVAYSDYADDQFNVHSFRMAADAYRNSFGRPARISSQGGYYLSETLLNTAIELGVEADVTVEPGLAPITADASFGAYATAPSTDFIDIPRRPYYPSRGSLSVPGSRGNSRPILLLPLTSFDYKSAMTPWHRRIAQRLLNRPRRHLPLSAWKQWPSPKVYWDFVARAVDEQEARYFAFATRTDDPSAQSSQNVWELLEYLPNHPIAGRLQFVDPLASEIRAIAIS
jgi:hypothetical protein